MNRDCIQDLNNYLSQSLSSNSNDLLQRLNIKHIDNNSEGADFFYNLLKYSS